MTVEQASLKLSVAGLTGLIGITTGVTIPATMQALDLFNQIRERNRRRAAKDLARAAAAEIQALRSTEYAREPDASLFASALATAAETLERHRLTSAAFLKLQLRPERAADDVLAHACFNQMDGDNLPATARRILACFYAKLREERNLLEEVLPDVYGEIMRLGDTLDQLDVRGKFQEERLIAIQSSITDVQLSISDDKNERDFLLSEIEKKEKIISRLQNAVRQQAQIIMELSDDAS